MTDHIELPPKTWLAESNGVKARIQERGNRRGDMADDVYYLGLSHDYYELELPFNAEDAVAMIGALEAFIDDRLRHQHD